MQMGTDNCANEATCENLNGGFRCSCAAGFSGNGKICLDVDECAAGLDSCNAGTETCVNLSGGFRCDCAAGFVSVDGECVDDNECNANPCDANAVCSNTEGIESFFQLF